MGSLKPALLTYRQGQPVFYSTAWNDKVSCAAKGWLQLLQYQMLMSGERNTHKACKMWMILQYTPAGKHDLNRGAMHIHAICVHNAVTWALDGTIDRYTHSVRMLIQEQCGCFNATTLLFNNSETISKSYDAEQRMNNTQLQNCSFGD